MNRDEGVRGGGGGEKEEEEEDRIRPLPSPLLLSSHYDYFLS